MKVSQQAFEDPLFVAMLQAARGPHDTKGVVPTWPIGTFLETRAGESFS
jgi:hypothetical protein